MNTRMEVMAMERLEPLEYNGERVLTTAQLAAMYETTMGALNSNFSYNRDKYVEGKHYYRLVGQEKRAFIEKSLEKVSQNGGMDYTHAPLYLWTMKGALLHAKSAYTNQAWAAIGDK